MPIETLASESQELERPELEILRALQATLEGLGARLRRVRVRLRPASGHYVCRLRARFARGGVVVIEARAVNRRAALEAASNGLRDALLKRASTRGGPESSWRVSRVRGRLLLALSECEPSTASPDWAAILARELQIELHVLRVLSDRAEPTSPDARWVDVTRDVQRTLVATRETRAWCDDALPDAVRAEHVCVRCGDFVEAASARAAEIDADLIVLSASGPPIGNVATKLARVSNCPVLVAREQRSKCTLLAATDLEDDEYPVLRKAAELGNRLHASVVAFHSVGQAGAPRAGRSGAFEHQWVAIQKERLEVAADSFLNDGEVFVSSGKDPATSIVASARELDADTIVVGIRNRGWFEQRPSRSVAAEVVERSDRSVIVVPIAESGRAQGGGRSA